MTERTWTVLEPPPQSFTDQFPNLPPLVAHLLYHRNVRTQEHIDEFLNPDYSQDIHDPFLFNDMTKVVDRLFAAMENGERITIHGDYDADGVSACIILTSMFRAMGYENIDVYIPHKATEGYGLNTNTVELLQKQQTKVIITCDCGISNKPEIERANELGMDVIVTDHHTIPPELPPAFAIIHPKIEGETYPDKTLAGGGVAFKLMQAMLQRHKETHDVLANGDKHATFEKWQLDMAAIASVADMVPLLGESRTLTTYGLIVLNKTKRIGMQKLLMEVGLMNDDGSMKREIDADTIGFKIAPQINAAGRIDHANVAYNLLATESPIDATDLAYELNQTNAERQAMTKELTKKGIEQAEQQLDSPIIFAFGKDWSQGIVGLVAGRLKDKYQKPAIVMTYTGDEITGSGRSVPGFNLIESMQEIPHFFRKYGGHPMACGFSLNNPEELETMKQALREKYETKTKDVDMSPTLLIDAAVDLEDVNWDLYDVLNKFEPFGQKNPKPTYVARGVTVKSADPIGQDGKHMKLLVTHKTPKIRKAMGWRMCNGDVNWCEKLSPGDMIDMVFEIGVNEWNGNRELQLTIVDLKKG